jgi:hypothetical protein
MSDGLLYLDSREPLIFADIAAVTLAATDKALYTPSNFPVLGGNYFARPGKKIHIRLFGRMTTGATPGNLTISAYYGDGTDANGTIIVASAAFALTASQTNLAWECDIFVHARSLGSAGTLFGTGMFNANVGVVASTLQPVMIPASAPAASGSVDLTAAKIISIQAKRSGSTAETMQVHDMHVYAN